MELKKTEAPSNLTGLYSEERREKREEFSHSPAHCFGLRNIMVGEHNRCNYSSFEVVVLIASGRNYGGRLY